MTDYKPITEKLLQQIDNDLVRGYRDEEGKKQYPDVKEVAEHYNVSYNTLRRKVGKLNWKQRRKDYANKVHKKVQEKKNRNDEEISEAEAEAIVVEDYQFNKAANLLMRAVTREIQKILDGDQILKVLNDGTVIKGVKSPGYQLMNLGKALESAQKVSKTAVGEPSEINETKVQSEGRYEVTRSLICSEDHIKHELEVLNAAGKSQGCSR